MILTLLQNSDTENPPGEARPAMCNAAVPVCMWILLEEQRPHGEKWRWRKMAGRKWGMTNGKTWH